MAEQKTTRAQILFNLENETRRINGNILLSNIEEMLALPDDQHYWEEAPGIFAISQSKIEEDKINPAGSSIATKIFINRVTMEIREFVAKFTDEPETRELV